MACDSCTLGFEGGHKLLALHKFELGPAYEDYARGAVYIPRVFRQERRIPNFLVPKCCADKPFNIMTDHPTVYLSLMAVWWTLSLILFPLYWRKRHSFPLTFRSPATLLLLWLVLAIANVFTCVDAAAGRSCNCHLLLIAFQIVLPVQMFYLTVKSIQLYFVYSWSFAKRMNLQQRVAKFGKYKWIMTDKPFLVGAAMLFTLGICVHTVEMTSLSMYSPTLNQIYSIRTYWWQMPLKYQKPTTLDGTRGRMCVCWDLAHVKTGDTSVTALNTTVQALTASCTSSYLSYCRSDPTCASACPFNDVSSRKCARWFLEYYSTGVCGYPEEVVNLSTSKPCFGVYLPVFYLYIVMLQLLQSSNFILMCLISRMDDQLYLRFELVMASLVGVPSVNVVLLTYLSPVVKDFFLRMIPLVDFESVVSLFFNFYGFLLHVAFPIILAYTHGRRDTACEPSISSVSRQESEASIFYTETVQHHLHGELMFALSNQNASEIYMNFAYKEFTVENFMFLQAVKLLMNRFKDDVHSPEIIFATRKLYATFIENNAPMEINLPAHMRNSIISFLTTNTQSSGDRKKLDGCTNQGEGFNHPERFSVELKDQDIEQNDAEDLNLKAKLQACLQPMVEEISLLILRDSWPRFRISASYPQFAELLKRHPPFDDAVQRPLIAPSLAASREQFQHQQQEPSSTEGIDFTLDASKFPDEP